MKRLIFIAYILSFVITSELTAVMFRVQLVGDGDPYFLENITVHFTDLNDKTFEKIQLIKGAGSLDAAKLPEKFNLNLILRHGNVEFLDGVTRMPYVLWGGQYTAEEIAKSENYDFIVQSLSMNYSKVIETYRLFFEKTEAFHNKLKELGQINLSTYNFSPDIIVEYPPYFENDQRKPYVYIDNSLFSFYLFPGADCAEQIEKCYAYLYSLQFLPGKFADEIVRISPEKRMKTFPDTIGQSGVDDKNVLLENLRIFSQNILFGSYSKELDSLQISDIDYGQLKKRLDELKNDWQVVKELPDKKDEKFGILKDLLAIKKQMHQISGLNEKTDWMIGVHAVILLELYKRNEVSLLSETLKLLQAGKIKTSTMLYEFFNEQQGSAAIIHRRFAKAPIPDAEEAVQTEILEAAEQNGELEISVTVEDVAKESGMSREVSVGPEADTKLKLQLLAEKYKIEDTADEKVDQFKRDRVQKKNDTVLFSDLKDTIGTLISDDMALKQNRSKEQLKKIKALYSDFELGNLILDTFLRRKAALSREFFGNIKEDKIWAGESIGKLTTIEKTSMTGRLEEFIKSLDSLTRAVSHYMMKEDEKIMFAGKSIFADFQESLKKITKNVLAMEVKLGKLLFLNDKFKLYSRDNLNSLNEMIETDIKLLKNNLLSIDHVNLSTKIVIYTTIKKMLTDYVNFILDYKVIEGSINDEYTRFSKIFTDNRHYLSKNLFVVVNSKQQSLRAKLRKLSKDYEEFSKSVISKYKFSKESVKQCIFHINRFLEIATPVNEEKIFREFSKSGSSILAVEKSVSGELELIKKIKSKLESQEAEIETIQKQVKENESSGTSSNLEKDQELSKLRKELIRKDLEFRELKKSEVAGKPQNMDKESKFEKNDELIAEPEVSSNAAENRSTGITGGSEETVYLNDPEVVHEKTESKTDSVNRSYYFSEISINGRRLDESLSIRVLFSEAVKGVVVRGRITTDGIEVGGACVYDNSSADPVKYEAEHENGWFTSRFFPDKSGIYRLRPAFFDHYGIEYLLDNEIKLTIYPKEFPEKEAVAPISETPDRSPVKKESQFSPLIDTVDKFYKNLVFVFRTKDMMHFRQMIYNRESIDIYNLTGDVNRLFQENEIYNMKINPMEMTKQGGSFRIRFLWSIETDKNEYSGISGFLLESDQDGSLGISGFTGNRFYE